MARPTVLVLADSRGRNLQQAIYKEISERNVYIRINLEVKALSGAIIYDLTNYAKVHLNSDPPPPPTITYIPVRRSEPLVCKATVR